MTNRTSLSAANKTLFKFPEPAPHPFGLPNATPYLAWAWQTPDEGPDHLEPKVTGLMSGVTLFLWSNGTLRAHHAGDAYNATQIGAGWRFSHARGLPFPAEAIDQVPFLWRERWVNRRTTPPVWHKEHFWRYRNPEHYTHRSEQDPELLAFFESPAKGMRNILTHTKPGRYLTSFFSDHLNPKQIKFYAEWQVLGILPVSEFNKLELKFATTAAAIASIYERGPNSCMDDKHFSSRTNPVRAYAAGDLAVAYLQSEDELRGGHDVVARCLVWPEKKVAGRVYPTLGNWRQDGFMTEADAIAAHTEMIAKLKAEGYKFATEGGSFHGATVAVWTPNKSVYPYKLPYLDLGYGLQEHWDTQRLNITHFTMVDPHRQKSPF